MTELPHRLLAVANSPISCLGSQPQSAVAVVHNVRLASVGESPCLGQIRLGVSGDRKTLTVSMREGGSVHPGAVELWRLTRAGHWGAKQAASAGDFIVVVVETPHKPHPGRGFRVIFDLAQSATFSGSIDASYLRARGMDVADAARAPIGGLFPAPSPVPQLEEKAKEVTVPVPAPRKPEMARHGTASSPPRGRPASRRRKQPIGPFATRRDLTARVWALRRQQVFPNLAAIARACEITPDVVKTIIEKREGLDTYLKQGCLLG